MPSIPLVVLAALGRNRAIGRDGAMPWTMPSDLAHFRAMTMGKPMIMGRRTFEAIGRVLPGRETIVVTHGERIATAPGLFIVKSPEEALERGESRALAMGAQEMILAGGATLYAALMPFAARLHLSWIDLEPEADTFFPEIDPAMWQERERRVLAPHEGDEAACTLVEYVRL